MPALIEKLRSVQLVEMKENFSGRVFRETRWGRIADERVSGNLEEFRKKPMFLEKFRKQISLAGKN